MSKLKSLEITKESARRLWLNAQKLDVRDPFGAGPDATKAAVEHLGYVQIDTINVIERCHHHILYTRIPGYRRGDLHQAQAKHKTVFEYWTHALSYVPTRDFRFFLSDMRDVRRQAHEWLKSARCGEFQKVLKLIKKEGSISIRDIEDDVLVEKTHPWGSRKPSKRALQFGFYSGQLAISEREGMLRKYELLDRHFAWETRPRSAKEQEVSNYLLERALRSQAFVSLDSICYLNTKKKPGVKRLVQRQLKSGDLLEVHIKGAPKNPFWVRAETLDAGLQKGVSREALVHILSPFDPLVIQRKRCLALFDYEHKFEAYLPKEKRTFGYFALPVLIGDKIVAAIDLKADRAQRELLIQKWSWIGRSKSSSAKAKVEEALDRFERFQFESPASPPTRGSDL